MITRRQLLKAGGLWVAGLALFHTRLSAKEEEVVEIMMLSDLAGSHVVFDPIGVHARPGQRIRWVNDGNGVHTATAYHPANDRHPLRIPSTAVPWDSGYLMKTGDSFEVRLTVPGIYDYYCKPHEAGGMVGRIIVAEQADARPTAFKPYPADPGVADWKKIPAEVLKNFPSVEAVLSKGRVGARD